MTIVCGYQKNKIDNCSRLNDTVFFLNKLNNINTKGESVFFLFPERYCLYCWHYDCLNAHRKYFIFCLPAWLWILGIVLLIKHVSLGSSCWGEASGFSVLIDSGLILANSGAYGCFCWFVKNFVPFFCSKMSWTDSSVFWWATFIGIRIALLSFLKMCQFFILKFFWSIQCSNMKGCSFSKALDSEIEVSFKKFSSHAQPNKIPFKILSIAGMISR